MKFFSIMFNFYYFNLKFRSRGEAGGSSGQDGHSDTDGKRFGQGGQGGKLAPCCSSPLPRPPTPSSNDMGVGPYHSSGLLPFLFFFLSHR